MECSNVNKSATVLVNTYCILNMEYSVTSNTNNSYDIPHLLFLQICLQERMCCPRIRSTPDLQRCHVTSQPRHSLSFLEASLQDVVLVSSDRSTVFRFYLPNYMFGVLSGLSVLYGMLKRPSAT